MKFAFAYAGIPVEVYDALYSERRFIAGDNSAAHFVKHGQHAKPYQVHEVLRVAEAFKPYLDSEAKGESGETCFAVFYIRRRLSDSIVKHRLFPFLLTIPVEWDLLNGNKMAVSQSKNELADRLNRLGKDVRACLTALRRELEGRRQRTPWLLPVRNFRSRHLEDCLFDLQERLPDTEDRSGLLAELDEGFRRYHPPQKPHDGHTKDRRYFVDELGMEFKPPGHELHGFHRPSEGHNLICAISARRRLGVPYHRAFHYDCSKGGGATQANLYSCHSQEPALITSQKHINIAPNDYTRPEAQK